MAAKEAKKKTKPRGGAAGLARTARRWLLRLGALAVLAALGAGGVHLVRLDAEIRTRFEGRRWQLPARVYGRPLELYAGLPLSAAEVAKELDRLRYRVEPGTPKPGTYEVHRGEVRVRARPFAFADGEEPGRALRLMFDGGRLRELADLDSGAPVGLARLEPQVVGSIYPSHGEDRILVRLAELPPLLPEALLAVEDRNFYRHWGVDPLALLRALWANLRAGGVAQGGSTITQQLVKNYFLSSERTLARKVNEAAMALLLERRFEKREILEAYLNEVYLGQQGDRAIHGVGLASRFYFDRPPAELELPQVALLVGMLRGPSAYDPRRNPDRARERRKVVLGVLADRGVVGREETRAAAAAPLGVTATPSRTANPYPAFLDLVRRQLREHYRDEDLRTEGLRVFTTLDPRFQEAAEVALAGELRRLEGARGTRPGTLEGAVVVARPDTGELLAVVGGREPGYAGFNRAADAVRPVGSLAKPAVYLAALEKGGEYTLATLVDDSPLEVRDPKGKVWAPKNYDGASHGQVTAYQALARSYNLATARLGLEVGVERTVAVLGRLGAPRPVKPFPSLLLGALDLTPLETAQVYQTLASGGFRAPLRAIRDVTTADLRPVRRYPLAVDQAADPRAVFLLTAALQGVVRDGTGKGLLAAGGGDLAVAGKTGTTDDLRDSWFAGFTGDWVGVVWVGRDDNQPTGLTGATGALAVWGEVLRRVGGRRLDPVPPPGVEFAWIDPATGAAAAEGAAGAVRLPFAEGSAPAPAAEGSVLREQLERVKAWVRSLGD
ncbi:MAG: penicillin-binding protein 1B [Deferrisomatales bacterium]